MTTPKRFRGLVPPMITPVTSRGALDEAAMARVIDFMIGGGADGVFILGTTGECSSVTTSLRRHFVAAAAAHLKGRSLLYVGIGDNCYERSVEAAAEAFAGGADAVVAQLPSYFPLTPDQMYTYYSSLADRLEGPLLMYNIPGTTHMSIPVDIVERLADHPRIAGFKDSENKAERLVELGQKLGGRGDFSLFVGVGVLMGKGMLDGMDGVVPSTGNLDPRTAHEMCEAAARGNRPEVERLQARLNCVAQVFQRNRTLGQSLAALKAAMSVMGLCGTAMLPPLVSAGPDEVGRIGEEVAALGLAPIQRLPVAMP